MANYQAALQRVTYVNTSDAPSTATRTVSFQAIDDTSVPSAVATRDVTVTAINDPPVNAVAGTQTTPGNTPRVFSAANGNAISVADADAGPADVQTTLGVTAGTLSLAVGAPTGALTSVTGNGTATLVLNGTTAEVTAALEGLIYTPPTGFTGTVTLTVTTNDLGNTGTGGALQDQDAVQIVVVDGNVPGAISFIAATAQVAENAGTVTLTIQRNGGTGPAVTGAGLPAAGAGAVPSGSVAPGGSIRPSVVASPTTSIAASVGSAALSAVTVNYATANGTATPARTTRPHQARSASGSARRRR